MSEVRPAERVSDVRAEICGLGQTVLSDERAAAVPDMLSLGMAMSQVARVTGISRATLYRHAKALTGQP